MPIMRFRGLDVRDLVTCTGHDVSDRITCKRIMTSVRSHRYLLGQLSASLPLSDGFFCASQRLRSIRQCTIVGGLA